MGVQDVACACRVCWVVGCLGQTKFGSNKVETLLHQQLPYIFAAQVAARKLLFNLGSAGSLKQLCMPSESVTKAAQVAAR